MQQNKVDLTELDNQNVFYNTYQAASTVTEEQVTDTLPEACVKTQSEGHTRT